MPESGRGKSMVTETSRKGIARTGATVALVNPQLATSSWERGFRPGTLEDALPRHGLTQLSASLKKDGHRVVLADLRLLSGWEAFRSLLSSWNPDFIGVTAHTVEASAAEHVIAEARRASPQAIIVVGGIHATMRPASISSDADYVIRGEGEVTLPRIVGGDGCHPRIGWGETPELDTLPYEDRELYSDYAWRTRFPFWDLKPPTVDLLTGRGCPYTCRFCCGPGEQNLFTRPSPTHAHQRIPAIRRRSVAHVLGELNALRLAYGFRSVVFHDDQFVLEPDWVIEFCRGLHREGFVGQGLRWWASCRADLVRRYPEVVAEMKRAGLSILSIGFESFSEIILESLGKGTSVDDNFAAARICRELGIDIFANVMLGVPRPDGRWHLADDLASVRALKVLRPRWVSPSVFSPIPGSALWDWCRERNLVIDQTPERSGTRSVGPLPVRGVEPASLLPLIGRLQRLGRHPIIDRMQRLRFRLVGPSPAWRKEG